MSFGRRDGVDELFLGTPSRCDGTFLVKLSKIPLNRIMCEYESSIPTMHIYQVICIIALSFLCTPMSISQCLRLDITYLSHGLVRWRQPDLSDTELS